MTTLEAHGLFTAEPAVVVFQRHEDGRVSAEWGGGRVAKCADELKGEFDAWLADGLFPFPVECVGEWQEPWAKSWFYVRTDRSA